MAHRAAARPAGAPYRAGGCAAARNSGGPVGRDGSSRRSTPGGRALPYRQLLRHDRLKHDSPSPLIRRCAQSPFYGIYPDVLELFSFLLRIADTVIEKIRLPSDAMRARKIPLPIPDNRGNPDYYREHHEHVHVIRHDDNRLCIPHTLFISFAHGLEHGFGHRQKRIPDSVFRTNRDEICRHAVPPNGRRCTGMPQRLPSGHENGGRFRIHGTECYPNRRYPATPIAPRRARRARPTVRGAQSQVVR